ncbi:hypothetical protein HHI36_006627 [Cryptolaemus montrouzieri]|uniref:Reverse transcriptase domain-containing protein n=1 Tax=Cryptolaemus montrouzieri TaxID=559131 RepID=A0ABD2NXX4_9CUCU
MKLHKPNYPIRPVSYVTAPSFKLSKFLNELLLKHSNFKSKFSVKNSYELIANIKDTCIPPNSKLISFDVENLFPNIPPKDTYYLVEELIEKNHVNTIIKSDILSLLPICLHQNYFYFNNKYYLLIR